MKTDSIRVATPAEAEQITSVINSAFRIAEEFFIDGNRITQDEVEKLLGVKFPQVYFAKYKVSKMMKQEIKRLERELL